MVDPKQVESIIERADMVLNTLNRCSKLQFKLGIVRTKVAFLGYQYIWGEMNRDKLTSELLDLGFGNLTLVEIVECIVNLKRKLLIWKASPRRETDPVKLAAMKAKVENNVRMNVRKGKF
jgi:hypothetical protein